MTKQTRSRQPKSKIFVSYAQKDQPVAERIERILTKATGSSIVVAPAPRTGRFVKSGMRREFGEPDLHVLGLTPHVLGSDRAQVELGAAWALEIPTLAIVADQEPDLQVPLLGGLEVAMVSMDDLARPRTVEDILHRIDSDRVA